VSLISAATTPLNPTERGTQIDAMLTPFRSE
jgi:hypothetical protein